ncbi:MAG: hypothetical protein PHR58_04685 [Sphaerochaetaceae bacterium]|nr:hypothetical protein [Sphaerochaetaceae bacterium]
MANSYARWLPSAHYELIDVPSFSFTKMDELKTDYASGEIWTPVKKR